MKQILLATLLALCCISCDQLKTRSFGRQGELLLVIDNEVKASPAGQAVLDVLRSNVAWAMQEEPNFEVSVTPPSKFDEMLKPVRNIMRVNVGDRYSAVKLTYDRDVWAKSQVVLTLNAPTEKELFEYVTANEETIINFFVNAELNRIVAQLLEAPRTKAQTQLTDLLGISVALPTTMNITRQGDNFFWASNDDAYVRTDFVAYSVPYTSPDQLEHGNLIALRDSVMKVNILGTYEDSYMTTEDAILPDYRVINYQGQFCATLYGLWEIHNDMLGGAFMSHSLVDEANNRLITIETFLYAPGKSKRNPLRRLQALLYTLKLPKQNQLPEVTIGVPLLNEEEAQQ